MTASKKHHYLPQFYLNGFTNEVGEFYVFDKKTEQIRKTTPSNSFFENHRNTGTIKDDKSDLLEVIYSYFDSETAPELKKIRIATSENFVLYPEILHRIKLFITEIYWRIPKNDSELEKLIDSLSFAESGFDFIDRKTGKSIATLEFQNNLKEIDLFRKMYRIFIPFISMQPKYVKNDFENWRVYFRGNKLQLTCDNPLIIEKFIDFSSLNGELLFPLCSDKIIIHTSKPKPKDLPSLFILQLDMLLIQQASRFVCCSDRKYLEFLLKNLYSISKNLNILADMKKEIFNFFRE